MRRHRPQRISSGRMQRRFAGMCVGLGVSLGLLPVSVGASSARPTTCDQHYDTYKASSALLQACGVLSYPLLGTTRLPDGGTSYHYTVGGATETDNIPPAGFKVTTAGVNELALYGIPPEPPPNQPVQRDAWMRAYGNPKLHFLPAASELHVIPDVTAPGPAVDTSPNWSGYVGYNGGYTSTWGEYVEPQLYASSCQSNSVVVWAGLGGGNGTDLEQAGTAPSGLPGL